MHLLIKLTFAFSLSAIGVGVSQMPQPRPDMSSTTPTDTPYTLIGGYGQYIADLYRYIPPTTTTTIAPTVYKHGDCSWLPPVAIKAGWKPNQITKLQQIALRESGCCPNRAGGDAVDKNCNITKIVDHSHRSDSGLLQLNGVNYDIKRNPYAPICLQMAICTQPPLFDAYTNLKAGKVLYDYWHQAAGDGWIPWYPIKP